ncbi:MAG TPA: alpha/beta hydrolase [Solirubrobacteraceae bacterium]|nr:alpha/beta hydrolase [Solirubrobacteraceae bacterium]
MSISAPRLMLDFLSRGRAHRYGPDRSQRAELHMPSGPAPHPVMVVIHGGSWQAGYGKIVTRGIVGDLVRRGWAAWNIEYRRVGNGGGWPATFEDVAAAIDHLERLDAPLDLTRVCVLGHSAGGHLALWAASREELPSGAPGQVAGGPPVPLRQAIAQAGVCDLAGAYRRWRGGPARALMGGGPEEFPDRYAAADPAALLPLRMPALLVHGVLDEVVSIELSRSYAGMARAAGAEVELVEIEGAAGRHRTHLDPRSAAWAAVTQRLDGLAASSAPSDVSR